MITTFITFSICLSSLSIADPSAEPIKGAKEEQKQKRTCRMIFPERLKDSPNFAHLFDG